MIILVCGSRTWAQNAPIFDFLDALHAERPITHLIHGDCRGVDTIADAWALSRGVQPVRCPALWKYHQSKEAGPLRNEAMALLKPDLVVCFPGGAGTASMRRIAKAANLKVLFALHDEK